MMLPGWPGWAVSAIGVGAVVTAGALAFVWQYQQGKEAGKAEVQTLWDADKLARNEANLKVTRAFEAERATQQEKLNDALKRLKDAQSAHARVVADLRANADQLRGDIEAFASGRRGVGPDTLEACRARAERLGQLLDGVLRDGEACAERGELDASIARSVLEAWPMKRVAP